MLRCWSMLKSQSSLYVLPNLNGDLGMYPEKRQKKASIDNYRPVI